MSKQTLETQIALMLQKMEGYEEKIDRILEIVIGNDGETSLVNRVNANEKKLVTIQEYLNKFFNPTSFLNRPVTIKHLIFFFIFASVWYVKELREPLLLEIGQIIKAFGFFL